MAYEVPVFVYPVSERFANSMKYEDLSSLPCDSTSITPVKIIADISTESAIMTENETHVKPQYRYKLRNEEIDFPSSS